MKGFVSFEYTTMHVMFVLFQIMEAHKWQEDVRHKDELHKMILL